MDIDNLLGRILSQSNNDFCKRNAFVENQYNKYIKDVSTKLNSMHNINEPVYFWKTTLGYWFSRHISITYDKFSFLEKLSAEDLSNIEIIPEKNYFTPQNHYDYLDCFCTDFGVKQLISIYIKLFAYNDNKKQVDSKFHYSLNNKTNQSKRRLVNKHIYQLISKVIKPTVIIVGVKYTRKTRLKLFLNSLFRIQFEEVPTFEPAININSSLRKLFVEREFTNNYEKYLFYTIKECMPRIFIEDFLQYYNWSKMKLLNAVPRHIISEDWIGDIKTSIFCAIARSKGASFVTQEHSYGQPLVAQVPLWRDFAGSDMYLSSGWKDNSNNNIMPGGVKFDSVKKYKFDESKQDILYIGQTWYPYLMEFSPHPVYNQLENKIRQTKDLIENLPKDLKSKFLFRPRKRSFMVDIYKSLNLKKEVRLDDKGFSTSISSAKIVILDVISSPLAEVILINVPFVLLLPDKNYISDEFNPLFNSLEKEQIVHYSPKTLINHIENNFNDIESWWKRASVQENLRKLKQAYLNDNPELIKAIFSLK